MGVEVQEVLMRIATKRWTLNKQRKGGEERDGLIEEEVGYMNLTRNECEYDDQRSTDMLVDGGIWILRPRNGTLLSIMQVSTTDYG